MANLYLFPTSTTHNDIILPECFSMLGTINFSIEKLTRPSSFLQGTTTVAESSNPFAEISCSVLAEISVVPFERIQLMVSCYPSPSF